MLITVLLRSNIDIELSNEANLISSSPTFVAVLTNFETK